jgi:Ca-activated chloride channel family protein
MYMPKLGIMRRRNKFSSGFVSLLFFVSLGAVLLCSPRGRAQSTQNQAPPAQTVPPSRIGGQQPSPASQTPPTSQPSSTTPPESSAHPSAPSTQAPAPGSSSPAAPASQAPSGDGQAQGPSGKDNDTFVFHAEAQEVTLHATVVDEKNHLVTNLTKPDFTVYENDQPQQIRSFRREDFPVAIGIVIDNSGSMREKREKVNRAAVNLVRASNPDDRVFVVNFNDEYYLDQDFTSEIGKLQAALEHVEARGGTALYDAVVASADYLSKATLQRKVLFVVTDGEDDASQESLEQAVQRVQQENGPTVYAIGLLGEEKSRRAKRALEILADRTGGIAFFPPTLDQVDEISRNVAHDIRNQYTISYQPTTPKNVGGFRKIHVDAHARPYKRLTVRTRTGYYPGQEQAMR